MKQKQKHVGHNGRCHCLKCNHSWTSIKFLNTGVAPDACPECKSTKWDEPRKRIRREK